MRAFMKNIRTGILLTGGIILILHALSAQPGLPGSNRGSSSVSFDDADFTNDTLDARYFFQTDPRQSFRFDDTLLQYFHEFDISHIQGITYLNLGFPGSPVQPLIPSPDGFTGFSTGLNSYRPYYTDDHNFRFFQSEKAITQAFYTKGQTQNDGVFRGQFARSFKDRLQVSLEYNRYTNFGVYSRQNGRNTNLGVGLGYQSKNGRLMLFGSHYSNIFAQQNNGGITTDTLFTGEFTEERTNIPTYLVNAATRDDQKSFNIQGHYQLLGRDSLQSSGGLWLRYIFRSDNHYFKFSDTQLTEESRQYYGELLTDMRGIRHFIGHKRIVNDASLNLGKLANRKIRLGLRNIVNNINQEPKEFSITEWKAYGDADWNFADRLYLQAVGEININRENTTFLFGGKLEANFGKAGLLSGHLNINQQQPSLIESGLYVNQTLVWENDFRNIFINNLKVNYRLPEFNFSITGGQILAKDKIYFNQRGFPVQQDGLSTLSYLQIYKSFRLGPFLNENKIVLQKASKDPVFRVPDWFSQHSLDFASILFKSVLDFKAGFDIRLNDTYYGNTYHPLTGQFAVEDRVEIPLFPSVDFRASFRVRYFRAFAMLHNILQPLRNDVYIQTSRYPHPDFFLRLGIGWIFIN